MTSKHTAHPTRAQKRPATAESAYRSAFARRVAERIEELTIERERAAAARSTGPKTGGSA